MHRACLSTDDPRLDANVVTQWMIRIVDRKLQVIGRPLPHTVRQDLVVVGQRPAGAAHKHEPENGESPASKHGNDPSHLGVVRSAALPRPLSGNPIQAQNFRTGQAKPGVGTGNGIEVPGTETRFSFKESSCR